MKTWEICDLGDSLAYAKRGQEGFVPLTAQDLAEIEDDAIARLGSREAFDAVARFMHRKAGEQFAGATTVVLIPGSGRALTPVVPCDVCGPDCRCQRS